jgi:hypothetical protein
LIEQSASFETSRMAAAQPNCMALSRIADRMTFPLEVVLAPFTTPSMT